MMNGPTREEFYRAIDALKADLREHVNGINERLDTLNGRTGKGEIEIGVIGQRVTGLEKEVYARPRRRAEEISDERRSVGKKDLGLAGLGVALLAVALKLLIMTGQFAFETLKAAVHK